MEENKRVEFEPDREAILREQEEYERAQKQERVVNPTYLTLGLVFAGITLVMVLRDAILDGPLIALNLFNLIPLVITLYFFSNLRKPSKPKRPPSENGNSP